MKIYRVLVVDNDTTVAGTIQKHLSKTYERFEVICVSDLDEAAKRITEHDFHFLILSICTDFLPVLNFAYVIHSREKYKYTPIVFISDYVEYIIMAYKEVHCCDYIIKPVSAPDIKRLFELIECNIHLFSRAVQFNSKYITFNLPHLYAKVAIDEILFVESCQRKCTVNTYTEEFVVTKPMHIILEMASGDSLMQSHRSFLININNIKAIDKSIDPWVAHFIAYNKTALVGRRFQNTVLANL